MQPTHFVLLHVDSPEASARFYQQLLDRAPVESSPTFAMFALDGGLMLGLWSRRTVEPKPAGGAGSSELAFVVPDAATVDATCRRWRELGVDVIQPAQKMDFGYTCTAADPDGHRLRVFAPAAE